MIDLQTRRDFVVVDATLPYKVGRSVWGPGDPTTSWWWLERVVGVELEWKATGTTCSAPVNPPLLHSAPCAGEGSWLVQLADTYGVD